MWALTFYSCRKQLHNRIISPIVEVWAHKTNKPWKWSWAVMYVEFASVPTIFRLDIAASFNISYVHQNLYQPLQKTNSIILLQKFILFTILLVWTRICIVDKSLVWNKSLDFPFLIILNESQFQFNKLSYYIQPCCNLFIDIMWLHHTALCIISERQNS